VCLSRDVHSNRLQFRLGIFDPPSSNPYANLGPSNVNTPAAKQLALENARQAVVLLQNTDNVLPFNTNTIKTVAVIGPNSNGTTLMLGNYYVCLQFSIFPLLHA
jgi:beta-glucosidase-like glycosyl hydrolase